jgi:hypothetical protein
MILIDAPETEPIAAVLAAHGWACRTTSDVAVPPDVAICPPEGVAQVRVAHPQLPLIVIAPAARIAAADVQSYGGDDAVDVAQLERDLPAAVTDWLHSERLSVLDRLAAAFGSANVAALLGGLRGLLLTALVERDDQALAAEAHRIAGLAGTLGFARLGRQWLRVTRGERPITAATRRATDHAMDTIDRATERHVFTEF